VQSTNEVRFIKLKVAKRFQNILYKILQINYFLFNFKRTDLLVCFLILYMAIFAVSISIENAER